MIKWISLFSGIMMTSLCDGQVRSGDSCDCKADFSFVTNYLEHHYSGFENNVTPSNKQSYENRKQQLAQKAITSTTRAACLFLIRSYLDFFKDNHLQIRGVLDGKSIDEKSFSEIEAFKSGMVFQSRERIHYDSADLWRYLSSSNDPLEGIYKGDVYDVAVVRDTLSGERDYYGIMLGSRSPLWEPGQVKLEMKRASNDQLGAILYLRNHAMDFRVIASKDAVTNLLSVKKIFPQPVLSEPRYADATPPGGWFQFKEFDERTAYLHIRTFDGSLKSKFDSAYRHVAPILLKKTNLIIDIRNNGGGSDWCWQELAKYFYTTPYADEETDFFCSTEIVKRHEERLAEMKKNPKAFGRRSVMYQKIRIRKMRKQPSETFVSFRTIIPWYARPFVSKTVKQRKVYDTPSKVMLMFNRRTASAAEGLILAALHSNKVITFGENSGGYITFGDVRVTTTPSGFRLQSATQRTASRFQYEQTGIPPAIQATPDRDWLDQARELLTSKPASN